MYLCRGREAERDTERESCTDRQTDRHTHTQNDGLIQILDGLYVIYTNCLKSLSKY